jgi:glycosyltransferase involved in cell wall biosynthesis
MIRVGFFLNVSGEGWLGGTHYFRNLLTALSGLPGSRLQPVLLTNAGERPPLLAELPSADWCQPPALRRGSPSCIARKLLARWGGRDRLLERDLASLRIDVLSHSGHLGPGARIPALAWIPDFQHLRLADSYPDGERRKRTRLYADTCRHAAAIIVSSHTAARDLAEFFPDAAAKTRVLQFVAGVPDPAGLASREALQSRYGFTGRYFFLPNQFWAHKNHAVVVEALAQLKRQGIAALVLATGNPRDPRSPGHFDRLMARAAVLGVDDRFRALGLVPYADLMALMWHSIALINPSRFEGWSTTVEEAKSLGVPALVSDIAVHREQAPAAGDYFPPDDAEGLAGLMRQRLASDPAEQRRQLADAARAQLGPRRAAFARCFEDIVVDCLDRHPESRR